MHQGKILQYTPQGSGLISSNGVKYEFSVENHWFSPVVPKVESVVSFTLDSNGKLAKVYAGEPASALPIGVVLKDGQVGKGLVICEGKKYHFSLAKEWGSDEVPKENSRVYVETDNNGQLVKLTMAPQARLLGNLNLPPIPENTIEILKGISLPGDVLTRIPVANVILFVAMIFSWYVISAIQIPQAKLSFTIGQALTIASSNGLDALVLNRTTYLNVLGWVALLLIFLPAVWRAPAAKLGVFAPLALMMILTLAGFSQASSSLEEIRRFVGEKVVQELIMEAVKANIFSFGLWISIALSTVGALVCLIKSKPTVADLLTKHRGGTSTGSTQQHYPEQTSTTQPPVVQPPAAPVQVAAAPHPECPNCHDAVEVSDAFCTSCGTSLKQG